MIDSPDVMIVHDNSVLAGVLWEKLELELGMNVVLAGSTQGAIEFFDRGITPKVILAHKGDVDPEEFITTVRKKEGGETIRIGFVSGEFYGETVCQTALQLGGDFGWDMTEKGVSEELPGWVVSMIRLGSCSPEEIELRGREIVISRDTAMRRMELRGGSIHGERGVR